MPLFSSPALINKWIALFLLFSSPFIIVEKTLAQEFRTFDQVEYITCKDPSRFAELWTRAKNSTVRIALLGDSQETAPGGGGVVYIPRLNYEFFKHFKNIPETHLLPLSNNRYGFLSCYALPEKQAVSRIPAEKILPGLSPVGVSTANGTKNITKSHYGLLCQLQPHGAGLIPGTQMRSETAYFKTEGEVVAELFAATHPESSEIAYRVLPTNTISANYFKPVLATEVLKIELKEKMLRFRAARTQPLKRSREMPVIQVVFNGTEDRRTADLIGVRFVNTSHPQGVVVQSFSAGGYQAGTFLSRHQKSCEMLKALGYDAVMLHYGANDGNYQTAEQYQSNLETIIALIRKAHADPHYRIILCSDPDQNMGRNVNRPHFDRQAGVHAALALKDTNILAVNGRRLMHDQGWIHSTAGMAKFTGDGVHYNAMGARTLAEAEVKLLLSVGSKNNTP